MTIYVNANAGHDGNGSKEMPFRRISDAAKAAMPGDEVLVFPGTYRENVEPMHAGTEDARITYRSTEPLGAEITGAEEVKNWEPYQGNVWVTRIPNGVFGGYNPYTTYVFGDWYFAKRDKHTGCVWLNDQALYEAVSLDECIKGEVYKCSWNPEASKLKWFTEQDTEKNETIIYANFQGADPTKENVEITVRRECFMPQQNGIGYITVSGFNINKAATTWAPPAAYQDGMIGPHWSKGWIIEDCEIWGSKCAGISLGKYYDADNDHFFTVHHVKSPTQMERDAVCRGQYHGWLKEKVGSHIIRRCNIHNCEQGGIIGRMGGVFSIIEDNHIHHINNMMELGGAEIAGIKMHAAIDVIMRRNHIHHCTMGIWTDWEAQGTRITQNLLHDNQRPAFAEPLTGGMCSQDIFVEVGHGPTLIDNNILLSDASLRIATEGVAMVHNLICGALTCVGDGTGWRYTPYHMPHRTEVQGFMTILHGDDRFYNNIFVQKYSPEPFVLRSDSDPSKVQTDNREVGTHVWDEYPTYEEWIAQFDMDEEIPNMAKLEKAHFGHLPVWCSGNAYFDGAKAWKKEKHNLVDTKDGVKVELVEKDGHFTLDTNIYEYLGDFCADMIDTDTLGKAFEPTEAFENPDGTPITFNYDYLGSHRGINVIPGPFASAADAKKQLF
ncbi:MAG: right-handed parallel beta-helix repeat-containing protein [Lachnospiraceae bacterium]|jgi:alpha-N-arabinofuranosidase|nr:right-handed parallel beta-helix repeat-containing protein [Lachnospiraceae bacterium]MCH4028643.1 right-handed parallel beta-helix repeat-containing protein [Lachnospiraceae bacterium]MCH4066493.1 right-handed parallel beta-helix repeat-containing protein [Lachnospiraceae bacterium]MCH4112523.1 right-handed parallel beta-helix repeat-containing protein [Lachnospiraceae bacterium]MCI1354086.1 right-handed parallel beta-helix repeat-containing protein [Lachnospiraceae bacterium]